MSAICFNLDQSEILSSGNGLSSMIKPHYDNDVVTFQNVVIVVVFTHLIYVFISSLLENALF